MPSSRRARRTLPCATSCLWSNAASSSVVRKAAAARATLWRTLEERRKVDRRRAIGEARRRSGRELLRRRVGARLRKLLGGGAGDRGALEELWVLRAPEVHGVGEGEVAEVVRGDHALVHQLVGLGPQHAHVHLVQVCE